MGLIGAAGCGGGQDAWVEDESEAGEGQVIPGGKADQVGRVGFRFREGTPENLAVFAEAPAAFGSFCYLEVGPLYPLIEPASLTEEFNGDTLVFVRLQDPPRTQQGFECVLRSGWVAKDLVEFASAGSGPEPSGSAGADAGPPAVDGGSAPGKPALVSQFLSSFASWIYGRPYSLGGSCQGNAAGDCSNCPMTVLRNMGLKAVGSQADWDSANFVACSAGDYREGDFILMGYSCSNPDHWVALSTVNDRWNAVSTANRIVDQSSDCAPYCGEGPMRPNLAKRKVCGCARHKRFQEAWSSMP
jgi:hypothetical protein